MLISKKLKQMKFLHLEEGWYPAVISEFSETSTFDKKTSFLNFDCVLNVNGMEYRITKSFITNENRNFKLRSFLESLDIIRADGTVDWLSILDFDYDVYVIKNSKNGQWSIREIEPVFEDEEYEDEEETYE